MASSFPNQIPSIIFLLQKLKPSTVLDIGKGFGKYGFLIHEYVGIDNQKRINSKLSLAEQSNIKIDAIEVDEDLILPHLNQIYSNIFFGDVFEVYENLSQYELILMIDVIEHLDKKKALAMLNHFLAKGSKIIIATPLSYFQQELYESEYEHHISHWVVNDFKKLGYVQYQKFESGAIYLLSNQELKIRGFGNSLIKKARRIARLLRNEI